MTKSGTLTSSFELTPSANESGSTYISEVNEVAEASRWQRSWQYFTSRDGWLGDYDYVYLITPNIWPLNRAYVAHQQPFFGLNDRVPILLSIILRVSHGLIMCRSIVSPALAIAGGTFNFDAKTK